MADVKQYVNIDPAQVDQRKELAKKQTGRQVVLEATVSPKKAGVLVYFEMKSTSKNIVSSLEDANFSSDKLRHLRGRTGGLPGGSTRCSRTDSKGVARMTIKLSEYGGDEFETKAYINLKNGKKKELQADKFVVWRRIYYQVSRFKSGPKGAGQTGTLPEVPKLNWSAVEKEFKDRVHNIELIDETSTDLITRRSNVVDTENDTVLKKSAREGYDPKREPLAMRVVMVNQLASLVEEEYERIVKVSESTPSTFTVRRRLWVDESMPRTTDWAVAAEWRRDVSEGWKTLDRKYLRRTGAKTFEINFQEIPKRGLFDWFREAQVKITLRYLDGSTNGLSWYNAIWIAAENMHEGPRAEAAKQQTTIHEAGHFIGMVPPAQSTHYIDHGHQGGHCSTGLSAAQKGQPKYWGLPGTCVMFGENATTRKGEFCTDCDKSVRTRKVVLNTMPASWVV